MSPLFVVEHERFFPGSAEQEDATGDLDVAGQRPGSVIDGPRERHPGRGPHAGGSRQRRPREAQGLPGVKERLAVHILVKSSQEHKIRFGGVRSTVDHVQDAFQYLAHVSQSFGAGRQPQVPTRRMRHRG